MTNWKSFWLSERMLEAIEKKWYKEPSPIQAWVVPLLLNWDRDIIWQAQTWTWKTASFAIPLLERLDKNKKHIQAIILTPTRELAIQVAEEIKSFWNPNFTITLLYGWQNISQEIRELKFLPSVIIWTPWRIKDHLWKRRLKLENISYFILDEADEMLNIWFREEIEEIMESTARDKKVLLFSATMPIAIKSIVKNYMRDYDTVTIKSENLTNKNIEQKYYEIASRNKFEVLCRVISVEESFYGIIFCRTKSDVDDITSNLVSRWFLAEAIHWDIEQKTREKILKRFKGSKIKILVATDVAARWIDVENLTYVVNYSLPENPEIYTHRVWRTGRAGKTWIALSFVSKNDMRKLFFIERTIKAKIKKENLPDIKDVIRFKKRRLISSIESIIKKNDFLDYKSLSKDLLSFWEPADVVSALLRNVYKDEFDESSYSKLNTPSFNKWNKDFRRDSGKIRLFIAKWKRDWFNPGNLIRFIESETKMSIWDVWKIDIFNNFSYMDLDYKEAEAVLSVFKEKNKSKPLVVKAKEKIWWFRWWNFRWSRWDNRSRR